MKIRGVSASESSVDLSITSYLYSGTEDLAAIMDGEKFLRFITRKHVASYMQSALLRPLKG
jgi:hypothetical protein